MLGGLYRVFFIAENNETDMKWKVEKETGNRQRRNWKHTWKPNLLGVAVLVRFMCFRLSFLGIPYTSAGLPTIRGWG